MNGVTRREFLKTSGAGVGLGLLGGSAALGLGGRAAAITGDFMPKATRRVVVAGGGWGGATAAKGGW